MVLLVHQEVRRAVAQAPVLDDDAHGARLRHERRRRAGRRLRERRTDTGSDGRRRREESGGQKRGGDRVESEW